MHAVILPRRPPVRTGLRRLTVLVGLAVAAAPLAACSAASTPQGAPGGTTAGSPSGSAPGPSSATGGTAGASGSTAPSGASGTKAPTGCGKDAGSVTTSKQNAETLSVGGTERQFKELLPASYGRAPAPLVIQLHGYLSGADGQIAMSAIEPLAESAGFVVRTPQGSGAKAYWNAVPHDDLPDDLGFIGALIDDAIARRCVDPTRVYVIGMSNGAFMTSLVACRLAGRVAAVAAVAGLQSPAGCAPTRPVPVLAIHGTDDRFVPADGTRGPALEQLPWDAASTRAFEGMPWAPIRSTVAGWAERDGCAATPKSTTVSPAVTRVGYDGCRGGAAVVLYEVRGGGHTWPGSKFSEASAGVLGPTTTEIDGNTVIWEFLRDHHLG